MNFGNEPIRDPVLVIAGGFGTRLKPVVADVPKALAPVCGHPFLRFQLKHWIRQGFRSFVFLLHHQADCIIDFLEHERHSILKRCEVSWVVEPVPLGTGGAIAHAIERLKFTGNFLALNSDTWLGEAMGVVNSMAPPAIGIVQVQDSGRYGTVDFSKNLIAKNFTEKNGIKIPGWISAGLYRLNTDLFREWDRGPFSLEKVCFPAWTDRGWLKVVPLTTDFLDMGVPSDYFRLCHLMEAKSAEIL